jgi:DNA polymerase III epsilon subunit-like protein
MKNKICVFDFETDGIDTETCSPVQIAAIIVDPYNLSIVKDSEFNIQVKPEKLENDPNHTYSDSDILEFHAKVRNSTKEQILESWKNSMSQQQAWSMFAQYLEIYHLNRSKKSMFSAPVASGYNIIRFDMKIVERFSRKLGYVNNENGSSLFYPRDTLDMMNLLFYWFESNGDIKNLSLDNIRDYMGISKAGAHDALKDVQDCAELLIRFMRLHRNLSKKIKFRDSFVTQ